MTRDEAVHLLKGELEYLAQGLSHPDTVVMLLIYYINETREPSLFDMVPDGIKDRINRILERFAVEGHISFYNAKGSLTDYTDRIRSLSELLGRGRSSPAASDQSSS